MRQILTRKLARKGCSCCYETLLPFVLLAEIAVARLVSPPAPTANRQSTKVGTDDANARQFLYFVI